MTITINGEQVTIDSNVMTIKELLERFQLLQRGPIVEHNGQVLKQEQWNTQKIAEKDTLEIVQFVGGG